MSCPNVSDKIPAIIFLMRKYKKNVQPSKNPSKPLGKLCSFIIQFPPLLDVIEYVVSDY